MDKYGLKYFPRNRKRDRKWVFWRNLDRYTVQMPVLPIFLLFSRVRRRRHQRSLGGGGYTYRNLPNRRVTVLGENLTLLAKILLNAPNSGQIPSHVKILCYYVALCSNSGIGIGNRCFFEESGPVLKLWNRPGRNRSRTRRGASPCMSRRQLQTSRTATICITPAES